MKSLEFYEKGDCKDEEFLKRSINSLKLELQQMDTELSHEIKKEMTKPRIYFLKMQKTKRD